MGAELILGLDEEATVGETDEAMEGIMLERTVGREEMVADGLGEGGTDDVTLLTRTSFSIELVFFVASSYR